MCHHHHSRYSLHDNLVNWFACSLIVGAINYVARQPEMSDNPLFIWGAGALWGILFTWALDIGREWVKTWRVTP